MSYKGLPQKIFEKKITVSRLKLSQPEQSSNNDDDG